MTPEAVIEIVAIVVTAVLALFGSTWYLGSKFSAMGVRLDLITDTLQKHIDKDDRRFDEVFGQQRELANQHFWMTANLVEEGKVAGRRSAGP